MRLQFGTSLEEGSVSVSLRIGGGTLKTGIGVLCRLAHARSAVLTGKPQRGGYWYGRGSSSTPLPLMTPISPASGFHVV